jgi:hypothetical protein
MVASGAVQARSLMIAAKGFNRQGLVISVLCHAGILVVVLLFARAAAPIEAVPPDAMQVEIIVPKEAPRYSGTPSMLHTSGTEQTGQSQAPNAKNTQPPAVTPSPQPRDQHQAQHNAPPKPQEPQTVPPQTAPQVKEPPLRPADAGQVAMAQPAPDAPAPPAEQTPPAPEAETKAAFLALAGGRLGGGFAAPPINSPLVGYDFTVPFRELLSTCGALPAGIGSTEKFSITVRVFLNRDGTVAAAPQLLDSNPSADQQALMQSFASGLQKCQPYTMLPQDQYGRWKTLDLVVHPHNYVAQ